MARLSKANKYAILWLKSQGKSADTIQKELDVTLKQIESVEPLSENTESKSSTKKTSKDFMIHETANRIKSVAIMTKEASSMNDDFKKNNKPINTKNNQNSIHKIS
jgi:hypothetical protein